MTNHRCSHCRAKKRAFGGGPLPTYCRVCHAPLLSAAAIQSRFCSERCKAVYTMAGGA